MLEGGAVGVVVGSLIRVYAPAQVEAAVLVERDREMMQDEPPCRALDQRRPTLGLLDLMRRMRERYGGKARFVYAGELDRSPRR